MVATPRRPPIYDDRRDAGAALAAALAEERHAPAIVVGLARGGVAVAAPVARSLGLPLDALAVRKVGHPLQPEYALGALTPDGAPYLPGAELIPAEALEEAVGRERRRARELDERLHRGRARLSPAGATCILVDDGLATGATMVAAARWARGAGASRVVAAVPVGSQEGVELVAAEVDRVVCPSAVRRFGAVSPWYRSFEEVGDERVVALLEESWPEHPGQTP